MCVRGCVYVCVCVFRDVYLGDGERVSENVYVCLYVENERTMVSVVFL